MSANSAAFDRLTGADPVLVDVRPAGEVVPGMTEPEPQAHGFSGGYGSAGRKPGLSQLAGTMVAVRSHSTTKTVYLAKYI